MAKARRLAVGLPVFNGDNYLDQAIAAIRNQTFTDFTLVISDNASTDATPDIVARHAAADSRIVSLRHPENLGAAPNYNAAYEAAGPTDYFCWIAHDDRPLPRFFEACLVALDSQPEAVLAFAHTNRVDGDGKVLGMEEPRPGLTVPQAHIRFADAIHQPNSNHPVFGVIRRSALDRTRLHGSYTGSDRTLLAELAVQGPYIEVPEILFELREHPEQSISAGQRNPASRAGQHREAWFDTSRAGKIVFPRWRRFGHYVRAAATAPVGVAERMRTLGAVGRWLVVEGNWKPLTFDLQAAAGQALRKLRRR